MVGRVEVGECFGQRARKIQVVGERFVDRYRLGRGPVDAPAPQKAEQYCYRESRRHRLIDYSS
jgi:hypothetical protein